ncbi:hypothetical protein TONV_070 [Tipula oleracea nudivirus]|uniref:Uncharacterized protein n=1 Tax=Tipula oleracea nudivirus TaxID=1546257 RepID=A0A0B4VFG4_9VIRU|nr:hypothetical protein TONV_070 [Tipula oleracea nudivirus]AJD20130.1 hypothetical protein TONV_070 [Tipula oleracea nudivirus]
MVSSKVNNSEKTILNKIKERRIANFRKNNINKKLASKLEDLFGIYEETGVGAYDGGIYNESGGKLISPKLAEKLDDLFGPDDEAENISLSKKEIDEEFEKCGVENMETSDDFIEHITKTEKMEASNDFIKTWPYENIIDVDDDDDDDDTTKDDDSGTCKELIEYIATETEKIFNVAVNDCIITNPTVPIVDISDDNDDYVFKNPIIIIEDDDQINKPQDPDIIDDENPQDPDIIDTTDPDPMIDVTDEGDEYIYTNIVTLPHIKDKIKSEPSEDSSIFDNHLYEQFKNVAKFKNVATDLLNKCKNFKFNTSDRFEEIIIPGTITGGDYDIGTHNSIYVSSKLENKYMDKGWTKLCKRVAEGRIRGCKQIIKNVHTVTVYEDEDDTTANIITSKKNYQNIEHCKSVLSISSPPQRLTFKREYNVMYARYNVNIPLKEESTSLQSMEHSNTHTTFNIVCVENDISEPYILSITKESSRDGCNEYYITFDLLEENVYNHKLTSHKINTLIDEIQDNWMLLCNAGEFESVNFKCVLSIHDLEPQMEPLIHVDYACKCFEELENLTL